MSTLRAYQAECVDAVTQAWVDGVQRPAVVLATGTGKTVIMSHLVSRAVRHQRRRPLILVHRDELVTQTVEKLAAVDPALKVGIIKAERHETDADVVVGSVQSLIRRLGTGKRSVAPDRFNFLLVDECHHASAKSYLDILEHFGAMKADSPAVALGVTATLARADGSALGHVWQEVVYEYGAPAAINDGWLVMPHAKRAVVDVNLSGLRVKHGDYSDADLSARLIRSGSRIAEVILSEAMNEHGRIRRGIVFAPTVACAEMWLTDFQDAGIRSRIVTGDTPREIRRAVYQSTHDGHNDMIISVMVLTEGFDLPSVEVAVIGRPTKSKPLYTQMIGRVLRPSPATGKRNALILDVCGVMQDALTTLSDLHLPQPCECDCDCEFEYLCPAVCNCPRSVSGRLKRPCIVCRMTDRANPLAQRTPCTHYRGDHGTNCVHRCNGLGRRGPHVEDEDELTIEDELDPDMRPLEIDYDTIVTREVELFRNGGASKPTARSPWLVTPRGIPFLPPTATFEFYVFLHREPDGSWTVGEKPRRGAAKRLETGLTFENARRAALDSYPYPKGAPALRGDVTAAQTAALWRLGVEVPEGCTKQTASELLNVAYGGQALDR